MKTISAGFLRTIYRFELLSYCVVLQCLCPLFVSIQTGNFNLFIITSTTEIGNFTSKLLKTKCNEYTSLICALIALLNN